MPLEWHDDYSTSEELVDSHHQRLFDFVNNLEYILKDETDETLDSERMGRLLEFLEDYVHMHFEYEEDCMFRHQCPIGQKNIEAHEKFLNFFAEFKETYQTQGSSVELFEKLHTTIANWITSHIMKIDTHLNNCIQSRNG